MVLNFLTAHSLAETTPLAAQQIVERLLAQSPHSPSLLLVYFTQAHDAAVLRRVLKSRFPDVRLITAPDAPDDRRSVVIPSDIK